MIIVQPGKWPICFGSVSGWSRYFDHLELKFGGVGLFKTFCRIKGVFFKLKDEMQKLNY